MLAATCVSRRNSHSPHINRLIATRNIPAATRSNGTPSISSRNSAATVVQAASKGIKANPVGDKISLAIKITGTTTNPKIETDLKNVVGDAVSNVKEEIKKEAEKKIDSVKSVVKDTVKAIKTQVVTQAKEELQKQLLGGKGDTSKKKNDPLNDVGDKAKNKLKGLFK